METKKKNNMTPFIMSVPCMIMGIYVYMTSTILPLTVDKVTSSTEMLSYVAMTMTISGLIGPYVAGRLSDKLGRRKPWVLFGGIIASIGLIIMGAASTYIMMWIGAFIFYFAISCYQGAYTAWMPESVDKSQIGLVNGWGRLFSSIGGLIIFGVGVTLFEINNLYPYYMIVILTMVPVLIVTVAIKEKPHKHIKQLEEQKQGNAFKESFSVLKNKSALRLFIGAGIAGGMTMGLITPFLLKYFQTLNGFSAGTISSALMGLVLSGLVGVFFGMIFDRSNKRLLIILGLIIEIIGCAVALYVSDVAMLWVFTIVFGLGTLVYNVGFYALIPYIAPKGKLGEYMGIAIIFSSCFQMVGQLIGGYVMAGPYMQLIFILSIISMVVGILIISIGKFKLNSLDKNVQETVQNN